VYKGFTDRDSAAQWLEDASEDKAQTSLEAQETKHDAVAYVDGSYDAKAKRCAGGCVITMSDATRHLVVTSDDATGCESRNVYGELLAALAAMKCARDAGAKDLLIVHDYEGIAHWATGAWRAKKLLTQRYRKLATSYAKDMKLSFRHVRGHTGVTGNEQADRLAAWALGNEEELDFADEIEHVDKQL
jgi:ribonuclease HI